VLITVAYSIIVIDSNMGSGISKHQDEMQSQTTAATNIRAEMNPSTTSADRLPKSEADSSEKESGCPMKRSDGSYSFDWTALFRKDFPHGPKGSLPIAEDVARERVGPGVSADVSNQPPQTSGTGGCPVKHQVKHPEYNVYSQPIDPTNNMPKVANQIPAPMQTKPLSTDRVPSTIPKVRQWMAVLYVLFLK